MNATSSLMTHTCATAYKPELDWWRGAVLYQIYPRSFQDSNGDGVGDLQGITERLDYVASIGVDAVWISPFFLSPMKDFGYDISNYREIDPLFGTLNDFDKLIERAHQLGLKIIIDQVLSHTSDQHEWFVQSRASKNNDKSDWYVWADPKPDGTPPNNWLSIFGGSAWQWDSTREQYYLHNFLAEQPDLNFHNEQVQSQLLEECKFWLDRGVDGFRLDTVNFYFADKLLRDNPALPPEQRNSEIATSVNPYNYQDHKYSKNQEENLEFLERLRALTNQYPGTTLLGEVGEAQRGLEIIGEYTQGDNRIHMCYGFELLSGESLTASRLKAVFDGYADKAAEGWPCWAFSNHDVERHVSRWKLSKESSRLYTLLMVCLRGSLCLYQGEELGLTEAEIGFDDLQDPYGIKFWPEFKGRDGCRTPMVWEDTLQNSGFTRARSWLPIPANHLPLSVSRQEMEDNSSLNFYRKSISFRQSQPALIKGEQTPMQITDEVVMFRRIYKNTEILCAFNLSAENASFRVPPGNWKPLGESLGSTTLASEAVQHLGPWQACLAVQNTTWSE